MSKFLSLNRADGYVWLVAEINGTYYYLHRQAKIGDRMRPGQCVS